MAIAAGTIIEQARDYSPLYTRQAIPDLPALKALSRYEKLLAESVVQEAPDALAQWYDVPLPLDEGWEGGLEFPESLIVLGGEITYDAPSVMRGSWEVAILGAGQAYTQPHMMPSVSFMGGRLYLTDVRKWWGSETGWEDMTSLRFRYVPEIEDLEALSQDITLPDTAEPALVSQLALWMGTRLNQRLPGLADEAERSAQNWVGGMINRGSTRTWLVEVVR